MFTLCVKDSFAAAHRLVGYKGKCEELHGHNFAVEIYLSGESLGNDGMLVDFKTIKATEKSRCLPQVHHDIRSSRAAASAMMHVIHGMKTQRENACRNKVVWERKGASM